MRSIRIFLIYFVIFIPLKVSASEASQWLKGEMDNIITAYQNKELSNENRFLIIEQTINNNFAGAGIAKFVAGKSWNGASKKTKLEYIRLFKRHLALNIASLMQGYSNQSYRLADSRFDEKNNVTLIDMEIYSETGSIQITWRVKKSKSRFFIIDLIVADISLVVTKRSEFSSMLKDLNNNLSEFITKLIKQNDLSYQKIIN